RLVEKKNSRDQSKESSSTEVGRVNIKEREADADRGDNFNKRSDRLRGLDHFHCVRELLRGAATKRFLLFFFAGKGFNHPNTAEGFLHCNRHPAHSFLFPLNGLPGAFPENANWQDADWKKNQSHHRELPIHQQEDSYGADDGYWLFKNVATDAGQRRLHAAGVVRNARHQKSGAHPIKEIHRVADDLAEELISNVAHRFIADPLHVVGISVGTKAPHGHDKRYGQTNPDDRIDLRTK